VGIGREGQFYESATARDRGSTFWHGCFFGPLNEKMFAEVFGEGVAECKRIDEDGSL